MLNHSKPKYISELMFIPTLITGLTPWILYFLGVKPETCWLDTPFVGILAFVIYIAYIYKLRHY